MAKAAALLNEEYNIFTQVVGDALSSDPSLSERMMLMSTYEEFTLIELLMFNKI